jgi:DNA-binding IclR family transcriptional regulator
VFVGKRVKQLESDLNGQGGNGAPAGSSSTVHRAVALLEALAEAPADGMSVLELSRRIGANRSTVYRIIGALRPYGYVRDGVTPGSVRLGFRIVELGETLLGQLDIRRIAAPHLRELARATGETCHLGVLDGNEVVYADKAESEQSIRLFSTPGKRMPIYCTSLGKAFLAFMPPAEREAILDGVEFVPRTDFTITDRSVLERQLDEVAERGWSMDLGENGVGTYCVGAPVLDRDGHPIAAISASGPEARMNGDNIERCGALVLETARLVSRELGR